jgi:hypothetical protein
MDYSICNALSYNMEDIPVALLMYDIMCQYWVNFKKRVKKSPKLSLPLSLELRTGIGLFHIHSNTTASTLTQSRVKHVASTLRRRALPTPRATGPAAPEDQRNKPLSDTQRTAAQSAARLSGIKTIQHSNPVIPRGRRSAWRPTPEDVQDYVDAGHHEHVRTPLSLRDQSAETTGIVLSNA